MKLDKLEDKLHQAVMNGELSDEEARDIYRDAVAEEAQKELRPLDYN